MKLAFIFYFLLKQLKILSYFIPHYFCQFNVYIYFVIHFDSYISQQMSKFEKILG